MTSLGENIQSRYESINPVDTEGLTALFQAKHRVLGSLHALRILRQPAGQPHRLRETFLDRARLQARLRHRAWVRVHNVFEEPDLAIVASDFMEGVTLDKHIATIGAMDPVLAASLVATLAEAVAELHDLGAVHHELRPGLIMLEAKGDGVKITHLSLSLQFTGEGPAVGYASPEALARPGAGDPRADVYSLGAILHHAVSGQAPEPSLLRMDALNRWTGGNGLARLDNLAGLDAIVRAATAEHMDVRTNDARALAAVLNSWMLRQGTYSTSSADVEDEVVAPATAPRAPSRNSRPAAPRAFPTGWAAIVAMILLGVGGVAAMRIERDRADALAREARSVALTTEALRLLESHKSDLVANNDPTILTAALAEATSAVASATSPRALGVQALARTWVEGWHRSDFEWDRDHFRRADASTALAAQGGTAEGELARAIVLARACKSLDVSDGSRAGHCTEAGSLFKRANASLAQTPATWLQFEAIWTEAAFYNHLAATATQAGEGDAVASQASNQAMALCDQGRPILSSSPANDRVLERDCIRASGATGRYTDYFMWANLLQEDDLATGSDLASATVQLLYRAPLRACASLVMERNRSGRSVPGGVDGHPSYTFCYAAGLKALGCAEQANVVIGTGQGLDGSLPWNALVEGEGFRRCYLDRR